MPQNRKTSVIQQVFVAVAIAILAGGTSPWWWTEFKTLIDDDAGSTPAPATVEKPATRADDPRQPDVPTRPADSRPAQGAGSTDQATLAAAAREAERVQAWYVRSKSPQNCEGYARIVTQLRTFVGNRQPLPADFHRTLRYAGNNPELTISSLAIDRSRRITSAHKECF